MADLLIYELVVIHVNYFPIFCANFYVALLARAIIKLKRLLLSCPK